MDSDLIIEQRAGRSIREMFEHDREPAFRQFEQNVIKELLAGQLAVLSLGGGAVEAPSTRAALAAHTVVYLSFPFQEALGRLAGDRTRPLLRSSTLASSISADFRVRQCLHVAHRHQP